MCFMDTLNKAIKINVEIQHWHWIDKRGCDSLEKENTLEIFQQLKILTFKPNLPVSQLFTVVDCCLKLPTKYSLCATLSNMYRVLIM